MKSLAHVVAFLAAANLFAADPIQREKGVIYLSDFLTEPMRLNVLAPAPAYFSLSGQRYVGTLRVPQAVEVQAISDKAYRIRGRAQQGMILGWVSPSYLEKIPEETLERLRASEERRVEVEALIAEGEVAIGMTVDEVQRSLGKPQKKTTRKSRDEAPEQIWDYVKYKSVPQYTNVVGPNGVVSVATTYVKTPVGKLTVTFRDGIVESIDQSEGTILEGTTTTVAPPITVFW